MKPSASWSASTVLNRVKGGIRGGQVTSGREQHKEGIQLHRSVALTNTAFQHSPFQLIDSANKISVMVYCQFI